MKITVNQAASFTGKVVHRVNIGSEAAVSQNKISAVTQSYKGAAVTGPPPINITLNALAYGLYSTGVSRFDRSATQSMAPTDIKYFYNMAFPRDFVHTVGDTGTITTDAGTILKDPFSSYRDGDGRLDMGDTPLNLTIEIPPGMRIGGNSHGEFVRFDDIKDAWDSDHPYFIERTRNGNHHANAIADHARYAMADPSFMIDYDSSIVTSDTIEKSTITIHANNGWIIGAGGFGGWGGVYQDTSAYTTDKACGGGGGGAGLHPDLTSVADSTWSDTHHDKGILPFIDGGDAANGYILGGQGGRSGSFHSTIISQAGAAAANGGYGNIIAAGAGGAKSGGAADIPGTNEIFGGHGGWGGSAVYFRSNVHSASPLSGTSITLEATANGFYAGGGGGGAGGRNNEVGRPGGALATDGTTVSTGASSYYAQGGMAGAVLFWNTANVAASNTYTLTDSGGPGTDGSYFKGRDIILEL